MRLLDESYGMHLRVELEFPGIRGPSVAAFQSVLSHPQ
jgi:hypothetical protein